MTIDEHQSDAPGEAPPTPPSSSPSLPSQQKSDEQSVPAEKRNNETDAEAGDEKIDPTDRTGNEDSKSNESPIIEDHMNVVDIEIPSQQTDAKGHLDIAVEEVNGTERRVSVVSFREVCELYEIDLEKGERDRQVIKLRPSPLKSYRYYIMMLTLICPFVTTYSRTIINFAITDMIDERFIQKQAETRQTTHLVNGTEVYLFEIDNSCPVNDITRQRLIVESNRDTKRAQTTSGEKFEWDTMSQGLLKSAYAYGHAFFQIPGSRLSEIYGSHLIISINAILIGMCCLAAPFLASLHFYLLFVDLMLLGILGSFMTPAAMTLFSNWLTPGEKSLMVSFMLAGSRLGYALSSFLCGYFLQADISWRYVFYSSGFVGLPFGIVFLLLARSRPKDHPFVSKLELDYLATKNTLVRESLEKDSPGQKHEMRPVFVSLANGLKESPGEQVGGEEEGKVNEEEKERQISDEKQEQQQMKKKATGAPWLALATSGPLWAFVLTKFCVKLAGDTVQIELPSYLKRVMHYSASDNGNLNAWNYVIFCVGCLVIGTLVKKVTKCRPMGLSKTAIRKLFQCTASFGVSLLLLGIAFSVCDKFATELLLVALFFVTTFGLGGECQSPYDLSERYAGTIHAIGSSLAISGAIQPTLVGYFLQGRSADKEQWKYVWFGASGVAFIGGLIFLLFAKAEVQSFDQIGREEQKHNASGTNMVVDDMVVEIKDEHEQDGEKVKDKSSQTDAQNDTSDDRSVLQTSTTNIPIDSGSMQKEI